jgi:hypothetical protein
MEGNSQKQDLRSLHHTRHEERRPEKQPRCYGSIIPYYKNGDSKSGSSEPWCYNDITLWGTYDEIASQSTDKDPFQMATDGSIPKKYEIEFATIENIQTPSIADRRFPSQNPQIFSRRSHESCHRGIQRGPEERCSESPARERRLGSPHEIRHFQHSPVSGHISTTPSCVDITAYSPAFCKRDPPGPLPKGPVPPPSYNYDTIEWMETFNG